MVVLVVVILFLVIFFDIDDICWIGEIFVGLLSIVVFIFIGDIVVIMVIDVFVFGMLGCIDMLLMVVIGDFFMCKEYDLDCEL